MKYQDNLERPNNVYVPSLERPNNVYVPNPERPNNVYVSNPERPNNVYVPSLERPNVLNEPPYQNVPFIYNNILIFNMLKYYFEITDNKIRLTWPGGKYSIE